MLSEDADGVHPQNNAAALAPLGFEHGQGGRSYGLEEVGIAMRTKTATATRLCLTHLTLQLAQQDPPFSIGRVQVS